MLSNFIKWLTNFFSIPQKPQPLAPEPGIPFQLSSSIEALRQALRNGWDHIENNYHYSITRLSRWENHAEIPKALNKEIQRTINSESNLRFEISRVLKTLRTHISEMQNGASEMHKYMLDLSKDVNDTQKPIWDLKLKVEHTQNLLFYSNCILATIVIGILIYIVIKSFNISSNKKKQLQELALSVEKAFKGRQKEEINLECSSENIRDLFSDPELINAGSIDCLKFLCKKSIGHEQNINIFNLNLAELKQEYLNIIVNITPFDLEAMQLPPIIFT